MIRLYNHLFAWRRDPSSNERPASVKCVASLAQIWLPSKSIILRDVFLDPLMAWCTIFIGHFDSKDLHDRSDTIIFKCLGGKRLYKAHPWLDWRQVRLFMNCFTFCGSFLEGHGTWIVTPVCLYMVNKDTLEL